MANPGDFSSQAATQDLESDDLEDGVEAPDDTVWAQLLPTNSKFEKIDVTSHEVTFGRKHDCTVVFNEPAISGYHCKLFKEQEESKGDPVVWIYDTSTNGTFMNGKKIGKGRRALISHGQEFSLIPHGNQKKREHITYMFYLLRHAPTGGVHEKYEVRHLIGKGAFAAVYECIEKETGKKYALKTIDKKRFFQKAKSKRKNALFDEVEILKRVDHPNVIKVVEVFDTPESLHIILELALGGDLFDRVVTMQRYPEDRARFVVKQMLDAIMYLHKNDIVHRDLKPENILLANKKSDVIKLSDFGLSRLVGNTSFIQTICGTPQYIAPELLLNSEGYTKDVDYWSIGVIIYILLCGAPPFHDNRSLPVLEQVKRGDFGFPDSLFKNVSKSAKDLVRRLLEVDVNKRLTGEAVLQHPWMRGLSDMEDATSTDLKRPASKAKERPSKKQKT